MSAQTDAIRNALADKLNTNLNALANSVNVKIADLMKVKADADEQIAALMKVKADADEQIAALQAALDAKIVAVDAYVGAIAPAN